MEIEEPTKLAFIWAGISSGPSIVCLRNGIFSGTNLLKMDSKSTLTSESAASLIVNPADVCCMNKCKTPEAGKVI